MAPPTSNLSATSTHALTQAQAGTLSGGSITSETRKQVFDLDQVGNWTHTDLVTGGSTTEFDWDFTHNKVNEITGWDNQTNNVAPAYDAAGNMTDDKRDWKYEYDAWYRLVRVKDQSNNVKAEFVYNALGYRLSARYDESAPWYHFAYDERWRIVAMYEDDADVSEPTEQFWYHHAGASGLGGSSYIDEVILRDRDTDANGTLDERRYYLQNQHHDVVALINTSGSISERVNYDPYGSPIGTFTSIANRKGYAGYEYDAQLGNTYHIRHRVYRSNLGRWTRRDPLGYVDGMSLYEYVGSLPVRSYDPLGLCKITFTCYFSDCQQWGCNSNSQSSWSNKSDDCNCLCVYDCKATRFTDSARGVCCDIIEYILKDMGLPVSRNCYVNENTFKDYFIVNEFKDVKGKPCGENCDPCDRTPFVSSRIFSIFEGIKKNCSVSRCKSRVASAHKICTKACNALPPGLRQLCKAGCDLEAALADSACEVYCSKP